MLKKTDKTLLNNLLQKLEQEIVAGKPTQDTKEEIIHFINEHAGKTNKASYDKGYHAGKKSIINDNWQYDPGDSRG